MKVQLVHARARELAATGQLVEPGEVIDVDDQLGRSLCEQRDVWRRAPEPKPEKAVQAENKEK